MRLFLLAFLFLGLLFEAQAQTKKITISGYIKEKTSGELLIGVNVYLRGTQTGTVSNTYGFYSLTIEPKPATLVYSYVGYEDVLLDISKITKDTNLVIHLNPQVSLSGVTIFADHDKQSDKAQMSVVTVPVKQIRDIPALLGEKDVFKVLQLMPGVRGGSEGSSGLYVRGGGPDQNLIILDDATVYNAMHLFGFFSVFNGDAIKSVELYKGGFPARYGGRLSSVLDLNLKDGNKNKFGGEGSIGLISSRLMLEGPIIKNKSSFMISGRRTYIDVLAAPITSLATDGASAGYYFYDLNMKVNYEISPKDKIYLSAYFGRDKFYSGYKDQIQSYDYKLFWENATSTLRWNHQFSSKLFSNLSFVFSNYQFVVSSELKDNNSEYFNLRYKSGIRDLSLKNDYSWVPNPNHYVRMGFNLINHLFTPSAVTIQVPNQEVEFSVQKLNSYETAMYIEDEWMVFPKFKVNGGLRFSNFNYAAKSYFGLEPRLLMSYQIKNNLAIKGSYSMMNQYIHLLTSTGISLPTDLWVPATDRIGPQDAHQVAMGVVRDFENPNFTVSVEAYYKKMNHIIGYKEGSSFLMIEEPDGNQEFHYEDAVTVGQGFSTGLEVLAQKKQGKFTGWIGYTLSYTQHQFNELNNGKPFFPRHDRRHDVSVVGIYEISKKITLSATWVYGTGDAITLATDNYIGYQHNPLAQLTGNNQYWGYQFANYYGEKNSFRMAPYHRFDIGAQFHKDLKWGGKRTIEVSLYNAYNRHNPYFYYTAYSSQANYLELRQVSLFPIIPSISYYLKF